MGSHEDRVQIWEYLEIILARKPDSWVREWCRQQGIQYSTPARLAYLILAKVQKSDCSVDTVPAVKVFPGPLGSEAAWRELLEWRHPKIDLNLLQLAIIMQRQVPTKFLWHPVFLREDLYRDSSGRLLNHPLHLMLRLRENFLNIDTRDYPVENIREELLCEERTIDLTEARLQRSPSPTPDLSGMLLSHPLHLMMWICETLKNLCMHIFMATVEAPPRHAAWKEHPLTDFWKESLESTSVSVCCTGSVISFSDCQEIKEVASVCTFLLSKLSGPQARPSTVEMFHRLLDYLYSGVLTSEKFDEFLFHLYNIDIDSHWIERIILSCQLLWAVKETNEDMHVRHLSSKLWRVSESGVCILKACEYLPRTQIEDLIAYIQGMSKSSAALGVGVRTLRDTLERRSLQDRCVLTIVEAVGGDVRKVWGLSQLPVPLKELFHVPFQALYRELQGESQAQQGPQ